MAKLNAINKLLASPELLTKERLAKALGISIGTARNTLSKWEHEGILEKISAGCYLSTFISNSKLKAIEDAVRLHPAVKDVILVGASCWNKVGWCETDYVHAVIPMPSCRMLPNIVGTYLHRAGQRDFAFMKQKSTMLRNEKNASLNPVAMMLWWMDKGCPIMMPAPEKIHWDKVQADPDLQYAVRRYWPEMAKVDNLNVRDLYEMIYMDRWDGTTPGVTEHRAPQGEGRVPFSYPQRFATQTAQQPTSEHEDEQQTPSF